MTDFYSRNDVNYNGDVYSIPFPYIKEKEIQVFLDDTLFEDWFFLNDSQIKLRNIPQEVTSNTIVSVRRITDIDKKAVTYTNNTLLNKENLNLSQDQLLFAVQEIYDNNTQFAIDIRAEVDEKVERVSDAVEKLEFLEDSVEIANEAALEATEQAQIATEKAEETLQTYETAMNKLETVISDLEAVADGEKEEIQDLANLIKENAEEIANRTSFSMFDTILKDHVLTYEESKGLALQGTYVYKDAIAGSRYGYPDFYNKCLEEFNEAIPRVANLAGNDITLYEHSNGHRYYDISEKSKIDNFFNAAGTAWVYGVDKENERIFLPRNIWFDQVSMDEVGASVQAGLPNITSETYLYTIAGGDSYGAITMTDTGASYRVGDGGTTGRTKRLDLNASNSSPVYGKSNTVQPNAVKKLLYICVGNTTSQSTITDVVEVTTTENDTLPLGYHFYQAGAQPSVSYLKSQGQWNDGNVYATFYNEFVQKIGQAFAGGKVVNHTEEYTDYDLVLNQDNMTFRLPLLDGSEDIVDYNNGSAVTLSTTVQNIAQNGYLIIRQTAQNGKTVQVYHADGTEFFYFGQYTSYEASRCASILLPRGDYIISGDASAVMFYPCKGNGSLYFKVANAVQNLELLNAGKVLEAVADIATTVESTPHIVERYQNGNSWYRIWSDGWCEQGSIVQGNEAEFTFTFLKPFKTLPTINVHVYGYYNQALLQDTANYKYISPRAVSLTGFKTWASGFGTCWEAKGYIA